MGIIGFLRIKICERDKQLRELSRTLSWGFCQAPKFNDYLHLILTEIQIGNKGLQFQILESRLNKLRALDLITRIGSLETERTI